MFQTGNRIPTQTLALNDDVVDDDDDDTNEH